jgi:hypothetical protein
MATNKILKFAELDTTSNLLTDAEYSADAQRIVGNQPGVARSKLVNKALRQSSLVSSALAQFVANNQGETVQDSMTVLELEDAISNAIANGMTFLQNGIGAQERSVKSKLGEFVSVKDFGAVGDGTADDTTAIQNAINSLSPRGGTIFIPAGTYKITASIVIGNGDGGAAESAKNSVKIIGAGAGFAVFGNLVPTIFNYAGVSTASPILDIRGKISDCEVNGIFFACNGLSAGIRAQSFSGSKFENLKISNPKSNTPALSILGGGAPTGNYNIFNEFSKISIDLRSPGSIGLLMDGDYAVQNDTWISKFDLMRIETVLGATNAVCAWFKFVDSCTFTRCHFDNGPEPSSFGAIFDALDNNNFPAGMAFHDCSIKHTLVYEDATHVIRKNYFYGYGTYDGENIPTHPLLCGITDTGVVFGDFLYGSEWSNFTPTVTLIGGSGNVVPQYANAWGRFKQIGKVVQYTILLDADGGAEGAGTGAFNIALPVVAKTGAVFWEHFARVVNGTTSWIGMGRILSGSSTMQIRIFDTATTTRSLTGADQSNTVRTIAVSGTYEAA